AALAEQPQNPVVAEPAEFIVTQLGLQKGKFLRISIAAHLCRHDGRFIRVVLGIFGPDARAFGEHLPAVRTKDTLVGERFGSFDFFITARTTENEHLAFRRKREGRGQKSMIEDGYSITQARNWVAVGHKRHRTTLLWLALPTIYCLL